MKKLLRDIISRRCLVRIVRATEIHIHGKKRTFVRLSRVKLDSRRHCVRSPARIASTWTTCLFSLSLSSFFPLFVASFRRPLLSTFSLPSQVSLPSSSKRHRGTFLLPFALAVSFAFSLSPPFPFLLSLRVVVREVRDRTPTIPLFL